MKRTLLRVLAAITSLALVLCVCEIGLMLRYRDRAHALVMVDAYDSPYVHRAAPNVGDRNNLSQRRGSDVTERPLPGTTRILSYGDSVAHGYGVAREETYSHRLEELLNARPGAKFEVLNMARGHSPTIHSFHLRQDVPTLQPRAVILQIELLNDVSDEAHVLTEGADQDGLPLELLRYRYILTHHGQLLSPITWRGSFVERTLVYGILTRWIGRTLSRLRPSPVLASGSDRYYYSRKVDRYFLTEAAIERGFEQLFDALEGIHRFLQREGVALLVLILPSQHVFDGGQYSAHAMRTVTRAEERARALALPFVSVRSAMAQAGGDSLYFDFCHPTANGNRVIAEALYDSIEARLASGSWTAEGHVPY
jgi:lysophospholipase L1-like esterase